MTTAEVSTQVGVPVRTLLDWVNYGILLPEGRRRGRGRYNAATWEDRHVDEIRFVLRLRDEYGFTMTRIHRVADTLRAHGYNPFSDYKGLIAIKPEAGEGDIVRVIDDQTAMSVLRNPGQLVLNLQ